MVTPQSIINLSHEVVEWMDGQRDSQFPFCDTYLMWHYFLDSDLDTYNCTLPYWRKHGNTVMEDIATQGQFKETIEKIVVIKGTEKGICLPYYLKMRESYYIVKGNPASLISKSSSQLLVSLEVMEYKLIDWKKRGIIYNQTQEGHGYSSGNIYHHNLHLSKGDIVVYVRFYDK